MTSLAKSLKSFIETFPHAALVEVTEAKGSTPRESGAWMLVAPGAIFGTIGGGQLEFMAIDRARQMLTRKGEGEVTLSIPLGPEIGQCCGGRVDLTISLLDEARRGQLIAAQAAEDAARPSVYLFGGGHVGHALASAFGLLPVRVVVVETRADALDGMPEDVETLLTAVPEAVVRDAGADAAFVVLTHDHALDFLIVAEALKRDDAAYVGMIGSKTKKETFRRWYLNDAGGNAPDFARLVSPIGGDRVNDKRPAVIAALAAAEIMTALARQGSARRSPAATRRRTAAR